MRFMRDVVIGPYCPWPMQMGEEGPIVDLPVSPRRKEKFQKKIISNCGRPEQKESKQ